MTCTKTGFHGWLEPHAVWLYGDAFQFGNVVWFRICRTHHINLAPPICPVLHFTIRDYLAWYDEVATSQKQNSTMICDILCVTNHGYEEKPLTKVDPV